jgi:hypothetical protein
MYYPKEWEEIDKYTDRLKIPNGWIVRPVYSACASGAAIHTIFIEDINYEWKLEE